MPGDPPKATRPGLGPGQGPCCSGVQYQAPLPPAALQVRHAVACSPNRSRGAGGRSGRRCAHWPGTGVAGGRRGHEAQRVGVEGRRPLVQDSFTPPIPDSKAHGVCGHRGLFSTLSPLNPLTFKASTYGPVPSPRVRLTLDPRAGTAGLAKDQQPLFSLFASLCSRGQSTSLTGHGVPASSGTYAPSARGF